MSWCALSVAVILTPSVSWIYRVHPHWRGDTSKMAEMWHVAFRQMLTLHTDSDTAQRRARTVAHDSSTVRDIFSTAYLYFEPASSPRGVAWPAGSIMLPARIPFARKMWMVTSAVVSFTISKSKSASDCVVGVGMGQGVLRHGVNTSEAGGRRGKSRGSRNIATAARRAAANYTGSRPAEPTVHPYSTVSQRARDHSETGCRDVRDKKGTQ